MISSLASTILNSQAASQQQEIAVAVAKMALDSQKSEGAALVEMLQQNVAAAQMANAIDSQLGQMVDVYA